MMITSAIVMTSISFIFNTNANNYLFILLMGSLICSFSMMFNNLLTLDSVCLYLILTSIWVMLVSNKAEKGIKSITKSVVLSPMLIMLLVSFSTTNFIMFYLSFELIFVLMFSFLMSWGKSPERLQASFYMFFYTMVFSLPFLIFLLTYNMMDFNSFMSLSTAKDQEWLWIFMLVVFSVKLPLFTFHLWLPKAHVEASVGGSMILAGVLLKLGGYGMIRLFPILEGFGNKLLMEYILILSIMGSLLMSVVCLRQMDLKMIIAYSSVVHMSVMMIGICAYSESGVWGSLIIMVSHGFISPMMFYMMTYMYDALESRSSMVLKSMMMCSPLFCLLWFMVVALNMSFPPFMSFLGEISIISSLSFSSMLEWSLILISCLLTGMYCVYCFSSPTQGKSILVNSLSMSKMEVSTCLLCLAYVISFPMLVMF